MPSSGFRLPYEENIAVCSLIPDEGVMPCDEFCGAASRNCAILLLKFWCKSLKIASFILFIF